MLAVLLLASGLKLLGVPRSGCCIAVAALIALGGLAWIVIRGRSDRGFGGDGGRVGGRTGNHHAGRERRGGQAPDRRARRVTTSEPAGLDALAGVPRLALDEDGLDRLELALGGALPVEEVLLRRRRRALSWS